MAGRYLLHFVHEHISFRWPEFIALTTKNNCKFNLISNADHLYSRPFILIELGDTSDEEKLIKSARESYLLKDLYELWAFSDKSVEDLALHAGNSSQFQASRTIHTSKPGQSFCIRCESFGSKLAQATKVDMISKMSFMTETMTKCDQQTITKEFYYGRHLAKSSRSLIDRFSLRKRDFIANTSMDPLLSMVAANAAQVRPNDLVLDPFVGSGSLLVAAAHMGAQVIGTDIDWKLLHGKSKPSRKGVAKRNEGEGVRANLSQYNLINRYVDVIVSDISRHAFIDRLELDSIIADPPYGIRESSRRIGRRECDKRVISQDMKVRFPSKVNYQTQDLISDLLSFAVGHLRIGGRLVYYLPITIENTEDKFEDFLPSHPSLQLIAICDQRLMPKNYRLMVIMEKLDRPSNNDIVNLPAALLNMDFRSSYFSETRKNDE